MSSGSAAQLQKDLVDFTKSLFDEGILNDQFTQLQSLQDESNPDFVAEVVNLFFEDCQKILHEMAKLLTHDNVDFKKLDTHVHQLKGSSSSIGAQKVQSACIAFRSCCDENNIDGCLKCLQLVKNEYIIVKSNLETLFKMEQQIVAAGGSVPKF